MTQSPSGVSLYLRIETYVIARFNIFDLKLERKTFECSQNACISDNCVVWVKKKDFQLTNRGVCYGVVS